jgi:hypothetical protein
MASALRDTPLLTSFGGGVLDGRLSMQAWLAAQLGSPVPDDVYGELVGSGLVREALLEAILAREEYGLTWSTLEQRLLVQPSLGWAAVPADERRQVRVVWEASRRGMDVEDQRPQEEDADHCLRQLLRAARRLVPEPRVHSEGVRRRHPRPRTIALWGFMASELAAGRSRRQSLAAWNVRYPAWRYTSPWTFSAHYHRAEKRFLSAGAGN